MLILNDSKKKKKWKQQRLRSGKKRVHILVDCRNENWHPKIITQQCSLFDGLTATLFILDDFQEFRMQEWRRKKMWWPLCLWGFRLQIKINITLLTALFHMLSKLSECAIACMHAAAAADLSVSHVPNRLAFRTKPKEHWTIKWTIEWNGVRDRKKEVRAMHLLGSVSIDVRHTYLHLHICISDFWQTSTIHFPTHFY